MAEIRAELTIMIDCAGFEIAMRRGRPNSTIAASASKNGIRPPKVRAAAIRNGGMWKRVTLVKLVDIVIEILDLKVVSLESRRERGGERSVSEVEIDTVAE
jgi:hypothetical protein